MRFFGEYLVQKGVLNEHQLLAALLEQVRRIPTYLDLICELKLLAEADVLRILRHQVFTKHDIKSCCMELGLWTSNLEARLQGEVDKRRPLLGELLVRQGLMTQNQLLECLQDYFATCKGEAISVVADGEARQNLAQLLTQDEFKLAQQAASLAAKSPSSLIETLRFWKGCFRFTRQTTAERICGAMIAGCEHGEISESFVTRVQNSLSVLWDIAQNKSPDSETTALEAQLKGWSIPDRAHAA